MTYNNNDKEVDKFVKLTINKDGEQEEEEIFFKTKRNYQFAEKYFTFFQGEFMNTKLQLGDIKQSLGNRTYVLFYLMSKMLSDNIVIESRETISKDLKIDKANLSRYLNDLASIGLIEFSEQVIRFPKEFVYKGQVKKHGALKTIGETNERNKSKN